MSTTCVLGAQWGDEGKARVVDLLADTADLIVRYQGGSNAGHTVVYAGQTYRLHLVPSGILRPGKINVVAHGVVVDPEMLLSEIAELRARGVAIEKNLVVSDRAHVVMPWHKRLDAAREKADGAKAHGTTGKGIGPCYADKVSYRGIRVGDLYDDEWFKERLRINLAEKNAILTKVYGESPLDLDAVHAAYRGFADQLKPFVGDAVTLLHDSIAAGKSVLFEGAQGVMLDVDLGNYPFVTGSNSCALGVPSGTGIPPRALDRVIGVTKAYGTRVGAGPFPTEDFGADGERLREIGREFGTTTGRPRRCGWIDAVALRYSVRSNGIDGLAIVKLDVLRGFKTLKMCVAYDTAAGRIETVPATAPGLFAAKPVWREYPGFSEDISGVRTMSGLPANARRFVEAIAKEVGAPISLVSVGPSREQVILPDGVAAATA
jgi:adenylosuccinate synthase